MTLTLRDYQADLVAGLRASIAAGARAPLAVLPTGGGKTAVSGSIADGVAKRGRLAWFVVPSLVLLAQTAEKYREYGIRAGVLHSGFTPDAAAPVQIITIQTLDRWARKGLLRDARSDRLYFPASGRRPSLWAPDLAVLDEAHHASAAQYLRAHTALSGTRWLGVTATPERLDGKGLGVGHGGIFDALIEGPTIGELIGRGHLVRPVVYAPSVADLSGIHTRAGDFAADEAAAKLDKPAITGSVVGHYRSLAPGARAVAFCCSIAHSQHVAAEFRAAGIEAMHLDGEADPEERRRVITAFTAGQIRVLTNCALISEGFDVPAVEAAILLRPTQSLAMFLQQVGRALRPAPGKDRALILDHVGNVLRHGMPDDDRDWSLGGRASRSKGKSEDSGPPVKQCPQCFACHRPAMTCPACGHEYAPEGRTPEEVDGELKPVDRDALAAAKEAEKAQRRAEVGQARSREDLERIAAERGYKPGWVDHQMRFRGGARSSRIDGLIEHQERLYGSRRAAG
ncbi:helicase [Azospirillum brasilense]|uniref:DEAD/DEAH box helicase n=1 Tax=Azospirillum brasilense TaxID=192 RepID=UPI00190B9022|nr:DEAD/DEAH box helicase [Azospirillum brasilense]MBK3735558.1 helicase [Azospirillum brasilense]